MDGDCVLSHKSFSVECKDEMIPHCVPSDYELAWSEQPMADFNSLKSIADVLTAKETTIEKKEQTLQYLLIVLPDYPAEFMLQPPHLFAKLLQISENLDEFDLHSTIYSALYKFLKILKKSIRKRLKADSYGGGGGQNLLNCNGNQTSPAICEKKQLKISKAMQLLFKNCLYQFEIQLINKVVILAMEVMREIMEVAKILKSPLEPGLLTRAGDISKQCLDAYNKKDDGAVTLFRLKYIWMTIILLEMTEINSKCSRLADQYKILAPQLMDFSLQINFPALFDRIKKVIFAADSSMENSFNRIQKLNMDIARVIKLLKETENRPATREIFEIENIAHILDHLQSRKLVKILFESIKETIPYLLNDGQAKIRVILLLNKLLQLKSDNMKSSLYQKIAALVKNNFASFMNNENVYTGIQNTKLLSAMIVGIPFDFNLIYRIICDSFEADSSSVRKNAENIVLFLLRTHHLCEAAWENFTEIFSPVLPMLICCTHSKSIYESLLKLFDPDTKPFPYVDHLRGNIGLMYVNDSAVRSEALTRLIYLLNLMPLASEYVPNIIEISDVIPNDLCMLSTPRNLREIFTLTESCYEMQTVLNLLDVLDKSDTEPQVRKSALLQLNIMCRSKDTVEIFCKEQAFCLVLSSLENALRKDSQTDYIENVIPAIGILAKLLIYDNDFRKELALIPNVYVLLLRALFHYSQDVNLRQDTSICLFLLVFGNFLIVSREFDVQIDCPKLIGNLEVPFKCSFKMMEQSKELISHHHHHHHHHNNIPYHCPIINSYIDAEKYVQQVVAHAFFNTPTFSKKDIEHMRTTLDICPSLLIDQHDGRIMRATNCFYNIRALLKWISNATNQQTLLKSVLTLRLQLMLHYEENAELELELPPEYSSGINFLLTKYLQVTPGNLSDIEVYTCVLDIIYFSVKISVQIIEQVKNAICPDLNHNILLMLKNSDLSLRMYLQLTEFLIAIYRRVDDGGEITTSERAFRGKLYEMVINMIQQFSHSKNFHHIRCLLKLSKTLSSEYLQLSEQILYKCSRSFIKLSINVRSSTQTGSEFHCDCLLNYANVFKQLSEPQKAITESLLKHIIGLCGHHDMDVRAMSWVCLSLITNVRKLHKNDNDISSGTKFIASKLSYLPGGLIGSCLCTFMDEQETSLIRCYAGDLFTQLLLETCTFDQASILLEKQAFFLTAYNSLKSRIFKEEGAAANIELGTCEIVISYCRICIAILKLHPQFIYELCEKPLLFKLYEILKLPIIQANTVHFEMCSQICHLYALCWKDNFIFLQQTLCHDGRWLSCLFDMLNFPSHASHECISYILHLVLVLCREEFVYHRFCSKLAKNANILRKLFSYALIVPQINSIIMRDTLNLLINLLVKSQADDTTENNKVLFICALEKEVCLHSDDDRKPIHHDTLMEINKQNILWKGQFESSTTTTTTTTKPNNRIESLKFNTNLHAAAAGAGAAGGMLFFSELILRDLLNIFYHFYPNNACKFDTWPSESKMLTCKALALLLKTSTNARDSARNGNLLCKILQIFDIFFQEFSNNEAATLAANKKQSIVMNLKILMEILLFWFSPTASALVDETDCLLISKIIIKCWPWSKLSMELKSLFLQLCSFISERSLTACRQFSTLICPHPHSVLKLVTDLVIYETHITKATDSVHFANVVIGLRVMMNCCACTEGRSLLVKEHAIDVIDSLYLYNTKMSKARLELLILWLQFWELFSRYAEVGKARNINKLCNVINQTSFDCQQLRIVCLKILRNMCFLQQNRTAMLSSTDFISTTLEIVSQPIRNPIDVGSFEEQLIVSVAIWQLASGGVKFISAIRDTKLLKKLRILRENLLALDEEQPDQFRKIFCAVDLTNVLEIINDIFIEN